MQYSCDHKNICSEKKPLESSLLQRGFAPVSVSVSLCLPSSDPINRATNCAAGLADQQGVCVVDKQGPPS